MGTRDAILLHVKLLRTAAIALAFLLGCASDPPRGEVRGRVTLEGKPLAAGRVIMEDSATGEALTAAIQSDGSYEMKSHLGAGLPPGTYRVAVSPQAMARGDEVVLAGDAPQASSGPAIPDKYQSVASSGLVITVEADSNPPFDFDLK